VRRPRRRGRWRLTRRWGGEALTRVLLVFQSMKSSSDNFVQRFLHNADAYTLKVVCRWCYFAMAFTFGCMFFANAEDWKGFWLLMFINAMVVANIAGEELERRGFKLR